MSNPLSNNDDDHLLTFIAATIESMRDQMATKTDLEGLATKVDGLGTKDDLAALREQVDYMGGQLETVRDQVATKSDVARLEAKIEVEITAVRGDIELVQLRLDSIERALNARLSQIEAEVSRLRSVVYLLVKDKPEMLRLLGQPPTSDEGRA